MRNGGRWEYSWKRAGQGQTASESGDIRATSKREREMKNKVCAGGWGLPAGGEALSPVRDTQLAAESISTTC